MNLFSFLHTPRRGPSVDELEDRLDRIVQDLEAATKELQGQVAEMRGVTSSANHRGSPKERAGARTAPV